MSTLAHALVAWLATYALHTTVLFACAWIAARLLRGPGLRELVWKTALVGSLVTASVAAVLPPVLPSVLPAGFGWRLTLPGDDGSSKVAAQTTDASAPTWVALERNTAPRGSETMERSATAEVDGSELPRATTVREPAALGSPLPSEELTAPASIGSTTSALDGRRSLGRAVAPVGGLDGREVRLGTPRAGDLARDA